MRIAGIINESVVDGEGWRVVIFFQGCSHNCKGCHNLETHDFNGGKEITLLDLESTLSNILESNPIIDGITLSGGDPFFQSKEIKELCKWFKGKYKNKTIWAYTGFLYEQLKVDKEKGSLLKQVDILVDGKFKEKLRTLDGQFIGSSNQRIIDVAKSLKTGNIERWKEI